MVLVTDDGVMVLDTDSSVKILILFNGLRGFCIPRRCFLLNMNDRFGTVAESLEYQFCLIFCGFGHPFIG